MSEWVEGVCQKLDERGCQVFKDIAHRVSSEGRKLQEGDYKYVYREDGSKIKLGKFLKSLDEQLAQDYGRYMQMVKFKRGGATVHISQRPEDILAKSTGQNWTSCETIGEQYSKGIYDDIKANNAIAYITLDDKPGKWLGRRMIRWCVRKDDLEPDAVIERYYGDGNYSDILNNKLQEVLRSKGFSGVRGDVQCLTPYDYNGYIDSGSRALMNEENWKDFHSDNRWRDGQGELHHDLKKPIKYRLPNDNDVRGISYKVGDRGEDGH